MRHILVLRSIYFLKIVSIKLNATKQKIVDVFVYARQCPAQHIER
jgi:hypothetical protein